MAAALSTIAVLGCAFGVYSTISASMIRQNYEQKQMNQFRYLADTSASLLTYGDRKTAASLRWKHWHMKEMTDRMSRQPNMHFPMRCIVMRQEIRWSKMEFCIMMPPLWRLIWQRMERLWYPWITKNVSGYGIRKLRNVLLPLTIIPTRAECS